MIQELSTAQYTPQATARGQNDLVGSHVTGETSQERFNANWGQWAHFQKTGQMQTPAWSETFDCEAGENVLRPFPPEKSALETVKTWEIETTEITKIRYASRRST